MNFKPKFTITNAMANDLAQIVSVKGFLDALLPEDKIVWHVEAYKFWATVGSIKVENL